jgi:poly(3-hydroxybutyrate) depolymerase
LAVDFSEFAAYARYNPGLPPSIIAGVTRQIVATQQIDPRRVYVAGMSAGGAMAAVMGAAYPDLYAAIGVHSGLPYGAAHDLPSTFRAMKGGAPDPSQGKIRAAPAAGAMDLARSVPTIVFHGDRDQTVHPRNGEQVLHQWAAGRAPVRRGQVSGGRAYTCSVYHDAGGRPVAERWDIYGASHAWSGGSPRGSYTDPQGPNASAEMVRFFLEHQLD